MRKSKNRKIDIVAGIITLIITIWVAYSLFSPPDPAQSAHSSAWVNSDSLPPGYSVIRTEALWFAGTEAASGADAVLWRRDYSKTDGNYLIFLPPSATRENIMVWHKFEELSLNGNPVISGERTDAFKDGDNFTLKSGKKTYNIEIIQSSNVGAIFFATDMPLRWLHESKSNRSPGTVLIVGAAGEIEYSGVIERINGRGNTSWGHAKKSYNFMLPNAQGLFGMAPLRQHHLIADAQDETLLRSKISYGLSGAIGLPYSPKSYFVELYIRGEYLGSYKLTEKIGIGINHLIKDIGDLEWRTRDVNDEAITRRPFNNGTYWGFDNLADPDDITGPYLLEGYFKPSDESGFRFFNEGELAGEISINSPEHATKAQVEYISNFYHEMEEAVFSPTGLNSVNKHFTEYLDLTSAAKMFLIQEFAKNLDGGAASFYMYKTSDIDGDGKLHLGPVWDFDNTFGNGSSSWNRLRMDLSDPRGWWMTESTQRFGFKTIFAGLFQHEEFRTAVMEAWPVFASQVEILLGYQPSDDDPHALKSLSEYEEFVTSSANMNFKRVERIVYDPEGLGDTATEARRYGSYADGINYLRWFIEQRFTFMTKEGFEKGFVIN